jgi:predicted membrane protein
LDGLPYSTQEVLGYVSMILALGFVFFGIKQYRDKENDGKVSFKKALLIGVLISLITALVFGILDVFYTEVLNPDFMSEYYNQSVETMKASLPADEFEAKLTEMESQKELFSNPLFSFALMAMTVFAIGFIISLLSALVLQRK